MVLSLNRLVQRDVDEIVERYEKISNELVRKFFHDMEVRFSEILENPKRFHKDQNYPLYRKVRMRKFPYYIVYRVLSNKVRILVIKHGNRKPEFGMKRF